MSWISLCALHVQLSAQAHGTALCLLTYPLCPFGSQLTPMIVLLGSSHLVGFQGAGPTHPVKLGHSPRAHEGGSHSKCWVLAWGAGG